MGAACLVAKSCSEAFGVTTWVLRENWLAWSTRAVVELLEWKCRVEADSKQACGCDRCRDIPAGLVVGTVEVVGAVASPRSYCGSGQIIGIYGFDGEVYSQEGVGELFAC